VILAGSGTLAMDFSVWNLLDPGQKAIVVDTGYFSDRMAQMLLRRGVSVRVLAAVPGHTVEPARLQTALEEAPTDAVFVTHVDTSTGVRADAAGLCRVAKDHGALTIVDGVCATAGEALDMEANGVDVYLTASQKAIGAPPGLALLVCSPTAIEARSTLKNAPPLGLDLHSWQPIMQAYEAGRASYFATPATSLVAALDIALSEIHDVKASWERHANVADSMRQAWETLGLTLLPASAGLAANTLSAIRYPEGVDATLPGRIAKRGVVVAGGLHPELKTVYFRVGHMGWVIREPELLARTVRAIGEALVEAGHACDPEAAALQIPQS
jgi:alanine-glyoxylate transaminase/serine-glyoxylate transaminase/serine-pyruvate transaminase